MSVFRRPLAPLMAGLIALAPLSAFAQGETADKDAPNRPNVPYGWTQEFPLTDWSKLDLDLEDIQSGGPTRDGIPAITDPEFRRAGDIRPNQIKDREPVIGLTIGQETRAYPLSVMIWHEVVNDTVDGEPVAVTFSPLCNMTAVFDRRVHGEPVELGVTGRLIHSCLIMYDKGTESWWEQMTGAAIAGEDTGLMMRLLPSRLESFGEFKERAGPNAMVMVPADPGKRRYGTNPYWGYDRSAQPMLYKGELPEEIAPLKRVVRVGDKAWSLDLLREKERIEDGDLVLTYAPGQVSALDAPDIANSRPVGGVIAQRRDNDGALKDVTHGVIFAFVFHAFFPEGEIVTE